MPEQEVAEQVEPEQELETAEESPPEAAPLPAAGPKKRHEHFFAVIEAMRKALADSPSLSPSAALTPAERSAVEGLYEAKSATEDEIGDGHLSAPRRSKLLEAALATLQPTLALGRSPGFPEGRSAYLEIEERVRLLRGEIKTRGRVEGVHRVRAKVAEPESDDEAGKGDSH